MNDGTQATEVAVRTSPRAVVPLEVVRAERAGTAVTEEQLAYASALDTGMKIGLLLLVGTFVVYMTGLLHPHIQVGDLPRYWSLPVKEYLAAAGIHRGWWWVGMLGKGDFLNFVPIALLSGTALACYVLVIPMFFRKRDAVYGWLATVEVVVLGLAASGFLNVGGH
jgi:hypothetical protein